MNIGGSQANDSFLRIPVQGRILTDAGPVARGDRGAAPGDGAIGAQRSDSLRTVAGNRIERPLGGGLIGRPSEGARRMEGTQDADTFRDALMRQFAEARDRARREDQ